jgi:hypothetical protein
MNIALTGACSTLAEPVLILLDQDDRVLIFTKAVED